MKVCLSGAHSTGKTTILKKMKELFPNAKFVSEITRNIKKKYKINESGDDSTQIEIMKQHQHFSTISSESHCFYDRCSLDGLVYTTYLFRKGNVSQKTLDFAYEVFYNTFDQYDIVFYIEPEFDIVNDNVRSCNIQFRDEIVNIFNEIIEKQNINIIKLGGSVGERVKQVLETLNEFN